MRLTGAFIMTACVGFIVLGLVSIPVEHAQVINQEKETGWLYLPHVPEDMDDFHYWAVDEGGTRKLLTFCQDKGFHPHWNEGQTVKIRYKAWPTCIELEGVAGLRDEYGKLKEN